MYSSGFYWIEGSARLMAEEIVAKVLSIQVDHFSLALYPSAVRRQCNTHRSFASLINAATFYDEPVGNYALAHAALYCMLCFF